MSSDFEVRCRFGSSGVEVVGELEGSMGADVEGWLLGSTTFGVVILSVAAAGAGAAISRVKCQRTNKEFGYCTAFILLDTHSYTRPYFPLPSPSRLIFSRLVLLCLVSASFSLSHLDTNLYNQWNAWLFGTPSLVKEWCWDRYTC